MILVTGGTGLAGSRIVFDLLKNGEQVRLLKRSASTLHNIQRHFGSEPLPETLSIAEGDVTDMFSLEDALQGIETVYHAAAFISFYRSDRNRMMKVNVEGTANMVNLSLKHDIKRFCHISSVAAIGREKGNSFVDEKSQFQNTVEDTNYAVSKFRAEREVWRASEEGLSVVIINPTIIIGPGDWKTGSSQMFGQIWKGMPYYTNGSTGFVDVRDVSKAAIALAKSGISGERFIVNSENVPYRYVFDLIAEALGKKKGYIHVTPFLAELGWRVEGIKSAILRKKALITRETARNGLLQWNYSNEKIRKQTEMEFHSIRDAVGFTAEYFIKEHKPK